MAAARTVLIIDDDHVLRRELAERLRSDQGLEAREADSAAAGLAAALEGVDLVLIDVALPDGNGHELCRLLRQRGMQAPIILLTTPGDDAEANFGPEGVADDYVRKPFRLAVLLARVRAHLQRLDRSDDTDFIVGPYRFRPAFKRLVEPANDRTIHLTDKETAILGYLCRAGDGAVSRATLLDEVWGYQAGVTTHTLETHVYRLRQKLEPAPDHPTILVTAPGGYRLVR